MSICSQPITIFETLGRIFEGHLPRLS